MADLAADWDAVGVSASPASNAAPSTLADEWNSIPSSSTPAAEKRAPDAQPEPRGPLEKIDRFVGKYLKGPAEVALSLGTGAAGSFLGHAAGVAEAMLPVNYGTQAGARRAQERVNEISQALTWTPRSQEGREQLAGLGRIVEESKLQGLGPVEASTLGVLASTGPRARLAQLPRETARGVGEVAGAYTPSGIKQSIRPVRDVPGSASTWETGAAPTMGGSAGAAGTNVAEQARAAVANASPELRAAVEQNIDKVTTPYQVRTIERQAKADKFGIDLMRGQATGDVNLLTDELNSPLPRIRSRLAEQDKKLAEAPQMIREKVAPDVYVNTPTETADLIIGGLKDKGATMRAKTSADYKALKDANGGKFPLDGIAFVDAADAALHKTLKFDFVPAPLRATMERLRNGGSMTFEQFESMRTNLANIARSNADGNVKQAAAIIRDALEALPMPKGAEHLKPLADTARASAKAYHDARRANAAFDTVEKGKAKADTFIDTFITNKGADSKAVARLVEDLSHDPVAQQAVGAGVMLKLKDAAKVGLEGKPFAVADYNKALRTLQPKLEITLGQEGAALANDLGEVAHMVKNRPTGNAVNTSGTAITLMREAGKYGGTVLAAKGIPIWQVASGVNKYRQWKAANDALQKGAGITIKEAADGGM